MKTKISLKNSKGYSLVEVLVATALLAVVSTFAAVLVSSVQDLLFQTSRQTRVDEVHANMEMTLSDPLACFNTFSGLTYTGAPVTVTNIVSPAGTNKFVSGNTYYQTVTIVNMQARNFVFGANTDTPAPYTGRFDLAITYRFAISATENRDVTRISTVKTAPIAWAAGNALAVNPTRCSAGAGVGFGFDIPTYLHRHVAAIPPDEVKTGNLTMNPNGASLPANLEVVGTTRINTGVFQVSDRRLKAGITPLKVPFEKIDNVHGYAFTWKRSDRKDHGFIAQEVETQFPDTVITDPTKNVKKMRYDSLVPVLAESTRTLRGQSRDLEDRIEALEKKLEKKIKK